MIRKMNLYNNVIKTQDVKLTDLKERLQPRFIKTNFQTKKDDIYNKSKVEVEIKEIRREAQERIKITKKEAYDRGFSEGIWKGIDQEKKKLSQTLESVMNTKDYHYIMEASPDFLSKFCDIKDTLIEDEEIGRGGVVIETHSGGMDARLDQQLNRIKETLPFGK
jgi:flagellar biosynthesis/type III secretory pathway protein FliH